MRKHGFSHFVAQNVDFLTKCKKYYNLKPNCAFWSQKIELNRHLTWFDLNDGIWPQYKTLNK